MLVRNSAGLVVLGVLLMAASSAEAQRPSRGPFPQPSLETIAMELISVEAVRTEIKLDEEKTRKIQEIADASRATIQFPSRESLEGLSEEDRRAKMTEAAEKLQKARNERNVKLKELLSAEQVTRLMEIGFQFRTQFGDDAAFAIPEFVEAAKVTDEQKEKANAVREEMRAEAEKQGDDRRAQFEWRRTEGRTKYAPKFDEILTAEQKEVLTKMKGAEFDVSVLGGNLGRPGQRPNN